MSREDCFERLDAELSELVGRAAHLDGARARAHRRRWMARRLSLAVIVGLALAFTLISEFPACASGAAARISIGALAS